MKGRLCTWGSVTALMGVFCAAPCFAQTLTWLGTLDYRSSIATELRLARRRRRVVAGRRLSTATPLPTAVGSSLIAAKMLSLNPTLVR
jgi:hypothetical protein